jgi:arylsulfatase A-like enzyme
MRQASARNVLFIMADQLRADHLGCAGHPYLKTPSLDALAARGVRFANAFVQSGVCGPSRMSFYTGRYVSSHGATWNRVPLPVGELTFGDHLRAAGLGLTLAGKTHVMVDKRGLARLRMEGDSELETLLRRGGFDELDRYDGHHAETHGAYAAWLRAQGYDSPDPWTDYVISAIDEQGQVVSGWKMRNVHLPARVREEHSETAYTTDRAIDFIARQGDTPWVLHLSYVKPHWPYMAPAPYHRAYTLDQCLPLQRHPAELEDQHPVLAAYRQQEECANFMRAEVSDKVRPAYQGLIAQLDAHLGRLFETLDRAGRFGDTLIVFTADHGDYLGDHWLGEKEQFHDTVQRVPFILYDPSSQADATRGTVSDAFVEAIDVVPTALDALALDPARHVVEGRSLLTLTRPGDNGAWREAVFSELDYAYRQARLILGRPADRCRAWMVRTARWKYVHWQDLPPQLFDLAADPAEFFDLGRDPGHGSVRADLRQRLLDWFTGLKRRTTQTLDDVAAGTHRYKQAGVFYGEW